MPSFRFRTAASCLALSCMGTAIAQDGTRADWLRNPALGNYQAYAAFKMGRHAEARAVWETLAEVGNGDALFNLGVLAEDGLGEPRDVRKAEQLYVSAAQAGNFKSQYRLGLLYSGGTVLPKDLGQARRYLGMAAQSGDREAAQRLAALERPDGAATPFQRAELLDGSGRREEAAALYESLAAQGNRSAQTRLAWLYEAGLGVARDLDEAARRFEIAARAGDAEAQYALAVMLRTGKGKQMDRAQSLEWLRKAAGQGHAAALSALRSEQAAESGPAR